MTGLGIPSLIEAAHILPLSESPRNGANPRNGLCLSALHHRAFDLGFITVDERMHWIVSARLKEHHTSEYAAKSFEAFHGKVFSIPRRFAPDPEFLAWHREQVFN